MLPLLRASIYYLSCVRRGLLVWTGVGGPDMSDGVEHATWPSLCTLLKEPWARWSLQPMLSPELRKPSEGEVNHGSNLQDTETFTSF